MTGVVEQRLRAALAELYGWCVRLEEQTTSLAATGRDEGAGQHHAGPRLPCDTVAFFLLVDHLQPALRGWVVNVRAEQGGTNAPGGGGVRPRGASEAAAWLMDRVAYIARAPWGEQCLADVQRCLAAVEMQAAADDSQPMWLTIKDVAAVLDISVDAVRKRIERARDLPRGATVRHGRNVYVRTVCLPMLRE